MYSKFYYWEGIDKQLCIYSGKQAEGELLEVSDRVNNLSAQNSALSSARRKLETENEQIRAELDEALAESKGADERAKKAVADVSSWMITAAISSNH